MDAPHLKVSIVYKIPKLFVIVKACAKYVGLLLSGNQLGLTPAIMTRGILTLQL